MDIWANKILIEFVPLFAVLLMGAIAYATHRYKSRPSKAYLATCDYVVFEAEPLNLVWIEADLQDNGWHLVNSKTTETGSLLYRFQKAHEDSRCLSEIFDFDKSMPRTANRTTGTHSLIKINAHGACRNRSL